MQERGIEKPVYHMMIIDSGWVDKLDRYTNNGMLRWPRNIRTSQVSKLYQLLKSKEHWDTPIVVNHVYNGVTTGRVSPTAEAVHSRRRDIKQIHIIDGAHRISALRRYFRENPDSEAIKQQFAIYQDLTEDQERAVYEKWSLGVKQTPQDWLVINQDTFDLWQKIKSDTNFPMKVSWTPSKTSITVKDLFNAFAATLSNEAKFKPSLVKFEEMKHYTNLINDYINKEGNYQRLKKFLNFFKNTFGNEGNQNIWQKSNAFVPIFNIYYKNIGLIEDDELSSRMRRIMGNRTILDKIASFGSWQTKTELRQIIIDSANKGKTPKLV